MSAVLSPAILNSNPSGPVRFAHYAYPPNALGYCGPGDPEALFGGAADARDTSALTQLAPRFEGAWPYLQLIAACNGISNPLDGRVVEAYWVGNSLLESVPRSALVASLDERFGRRAGRHLASIADAPLRGGVAHHSFHVFAVYPWLGLLRAGMEGAPLEVLNRCRIRWGTVETLLGDFAVVRSRPLRFDGSKLVLGNDEREIVRHSVDGVGFNAELSGGDLVSLHWDWICERLSATACARLAHYTAINLAAVNALPTPGPAVVTDRFGGDDAVGVYSPSGGAVAAGAAATSRRTSTRTTPRQPSSALT